MNLGLYRMKKKEGFTLRSVGGEQVLVAEGLEHVDFSRIISLNETAAFLWQRIGCEEFDAARMAGLLVEEYDVDRATALADAEELLQAWQRAGIVAG